MCCYVIYNLMGYLVPRWHMSMTSEVRTQLFRQPVSGKGIFAVYHLSNSGTFCTTISVASRVWEIVIKTVPSVADLKTNAWDPLESHSVHSSTLDRTMMIRRNYNGLSWYISLPSTNPVSHMQYLVRFSWLESDRTPKYAVGRAKEAAIASRAVRRYSPEICGEERLVIACTIQATYKSRVRWQRIGQAHMALFAHIRSLFSTRT